MAGRRVQDNKQQPKPLRRVASYDRKVKFWQARLAAARTPKEKVAVAADCLRAALQHGPAPAGQLDELIDQMTALANRINKNALRGVDRDRR